VGLQQRHQFFNVAAYHAGKILGCPAQHLKVFIFHAFRNKRIPRRLLKFFSQLRHDVSRGAFWRNESEPGWHGDVGKSRFSKGWNIGKVRQALRAGNGKSACFLLL
jgi:hypothetical protein